MKGRITREINYARKPPRFFNFPRLGQRRGVMLNRILNQSLDSNTYHRISLQYSVVKYNFINGFEIRNDKSET